MLFTVRRSHNMWPQEPWSIGSSSKISPYPLGYIHTILRLRFPCFFVLVSSIALVFPKHILLGNQYIADSNLNLYRLHTFQSNGLIVCWSIFLMRLPSHLLERPQFVDWLNGLEAAQHGVIFPVNKFK